MISESIEMEHWHEMGLRTLTEPFFITPIPGMSSMNTDILKHSFCKYKKLFKIILVLSYFIDYFTLRWALIGSEFFSRSSIATDLLPIA